MNADNAHQMYDFARNIPSKIWMFIVDYWETHRQIDDDFESKCTLNYETRILCEMIKFNVSITPPLIWKILFMHEIFVKAWSLGELCHFEESDSFKCIMKALEHNKTVRYVTFRDWCIGLNYRIDYAHRTLVNNKCLRKLSLTACYLRDEHYVVIADALYWNEGITYLNLGNNYPVNMFASNTIGQRGFDAVWNSMYRKTDNKINTIKLEGLDLRSLDMTCMAQVIRCDKGLRELYVSHANLSDDDGCELFNIVGQIGESLSKLDLSYNEFGTECMRALGKSIVQNTNLSELNISGLTSDEGLSTLFGYLELNKGINAICSYGVSVSYVGIERIKRSIINGSTITKLDIRRVKLDNRMLLSIAELLNLECLSELHLSCNTAITIVGYANLGLSLRTAKNLKLLELGEFAGEAVAIVRDLRFNKSIQHLILGDVTSIATSIYITLLILHNYTVTQMPISVWPYTIRGNHEAQISRNSELVQAQLDINEDLGSERWCNKVQALEDEPLVNNKYYDNLSVMIKLLILVDN